MANEFQLLPNPTNVPEAVSTGYQRQNINFFALQTGLDTTNPVITNDGNSIFIPAGGIIEANGSLFKLLNDTSIDIPDINNDYYMRVTDNGDGTATLSLTEDYPTFIPSKNGWYTADNERVLNKFYMRKILVRRDANNENIDAVVFIDIPPKPVVRTILTPLSVARSFLAAAVLGDGSVLFGGGYGGSTDVDVVDRYDTHGITTILTPLSAARDSL
jgi:hypothetical protein